MGGGGGLGTRVMSKEGYVVIGSEYQGNGRLDSGGTRVMSKRGYVVIELGLLGNGTED